MDQILDSPVRASNRFQYAGFWIRVAAYIIDGVILWIVDIGIAFTFFGGFEFGQVNWPLTGVNALLSFLYFSIMESSARQATFGKMGVGIMVGDANGDRLSFANAVGRHAAKLLSFLILFIGVLMVAWDTKKQGLHDLMAGTYVFYKR